MKTAESIDIPLSSTLQCNVSLVLGWYLHVGYKLKSVALQRQKPEITKHLDAQKMLLPLSNDDGWYAHSLPYIRHFQCWCFFQYKLVLLLYTSKRHERHTFYRPNIFCLASLCILFSAAMIAFTTIYFTIYMARCPYIESVLIAQHSILFTFGKMWLCSECTTSAIQFFSLFGFNHFYIHTNAMNIYFVLLL